ncbi:hypothetical protein ABG067_000620 [Albugo candida]
MLRHLLVEATSIHDSTAPNYLLEQIGQRTHASCRDAERIAEYLLERLAKSNLNVKLKAMEAIHYCMHEGHQVFVSRIYQSHYEIEKYLDTQSIASSMYDEKKYLRLRVLAAEIINPDPIRRSNSPISSVSLSPRSTTLSPVSDGSSGETRAIDSPPSIYGRKSFPAISQVSNKYDHTFQANTLAMNASTALNGTYKYDTSCQGYSAYMNDDDRQPPKRTALKTSSIHQESSLAQIEASSATRGVWSCAGFRKVSSSAMRDTTSPCKLAHDNAPMLLTGVQPGFARPCSSVTPNYTVSGSLTEPNNRPVGAKHSSLSNGVEVGTRNPTHNGWWQSQSINGIENKSNVSVYNENTSKLSKTMESFVKMSLEAKERWDCRNLEKSMACSLADNDVLGSAPVDCDVLIPKVTYDDDTDAQSSYERGLIDKLCTSGGIARAPPASEVKRFITLARNLNVGTIASILLEKCSDPVWQVRLKSLFVVLALLDAPGCAAYTAYFQQHASTLLELKHDKKALIVAKAFRIFALLGVSSKDTDHSMSTAHKSSVEPQLIDLELPPQKMSSPVGLI